MASSLKKDRILGSSALSRILFYKWTFKCWNFKPLRWKLSELWVFKILKSGGTLCQGLRYLKHKQLEQSIHFVWNSLRRILYFQSSRDIVLSLHQIDFLKEHSEMWIGASVLLYCFHVNLRPKELQDMESFIHFLNSYRPLFLNKTKNLKPISLECTNKSKICKN